MIEYDIQFDTLNGRLIVRGHFCPGSVPVNIPDSYPDRFICISYYLHIEDIQKSISFLKCISADKPEIINEALFVAGLNCFMKCFKVSRAREKIPKEDFLGDNRGVENEFHFFESIRERHYMHDENSMLTPSAFLVIHPESMPERLGPVSVVWNAVKIDYYEQSERLRYLATLALEYAKDRFERYCKDIIDRYKELPRETLLEFGSPNIIPANISAVDQNRLQVITKEVRTE